MFAMLSHASSMLPALKVVLDHRNSEDDGVKQEKPWELFWLTRNPRILLLSGTNLKIKNIRKSQKACSRAVEASTLEHLTRMLSARIETALCCVATKI